MITIEINKKFYSIPQHWNELSKEQLLQVMDCMFLKNYKAEQLLLKLMKIVTNTSYKKMFNWDAADVEEKFYRLVFLLKADFEFTKQLVPHYVHGNTKFYGPADALDNLRMSEFTFSEDYFIQWADQKNDIDALNNLVAILYREGRENYDFKKDPEGDAREPFNQNISTYHAKHCVSKWPMDVKLAIATWYDGCRRAKVAKYDNVFGGTGEPSKYGMVSTMLSVAEGGAFGDIHQVENEFIDLVLMHLDESIEKAKKLEAQSKA